MNAQLAKPLPPLSSDTIDPTTKKWEDWIEEHGSKLLLFARQQSRSLADAEDILQESLIKLARKLSDGSFVGGEESFLPFLYSSIRRLAIDYGRKNDRRQRREEIVASDEHLHNPVDEPWFEKHEIEDETKDVLEQCLKEIPDKFSEVIIMKVWGERTFAEIGEILGVSQNTAASRYRYGIEGLKKKMEAAISRGDFDVN